MKTIDLNAYQNELVRDILATDNLEVLQTVRRAYHRAVNKVVKKVEAETPAPYTMEELNARIDEAEAEEGGTPSETFFAQMEREMPWLCK